MHPHSFDSYVFRTVTESEKKVIEALRKIAKRGNDAEIRTTKNAEFKVLEVKKNIVVG